MINNLRENLIKDVQTDIGPVIYWMSRDQRVHNNWALIHAQNKAFELKTELFVVFNLLDEFLSAQSFQFDFMKQGLNEVAHELYKNNIHFVVLKGDPVQTIPDFAHKIKVSYVYTDFSPLKINKKWIEDIKKELNCNFIQVDAHNIVPVWVASPKQEWGAYTLRPKINKLLPNFLTPFPKIEKHTFNKNVEKAHEFAIKSNNWISGTKQANKLLDDFINIKAKNYNEMRNDPNSKTESSLSPYLHFGQICSQEIALKVNEGGHKLESFLEELIVRKELSDNFCYYNDNYDNFDGFPDWAKNSLNEHKDDTREYIYTLDEFEKAQTHEDLWNAAQLQMVKTGKMHGYLRMYWAKKILEWTQTPQEAQKIAIYLNDKYELDGRDPNGYTGIAWSIGGVHDRPWFERPIFGKIRYMNKNGAEKKFDTKKYIQENL